MYVQGVVLDEDITLFAMFAMNRKEKNSVACSPQANYTDRVTAACQRN
jgi:hypothetical protein